MSARVPKRGRGALLARSWRLLLALESRSRFGLSLSEAVNLCGDEVSECTIRRDFAALSEIFPIEPYQGKARYRLNLEGFAGGRQLLRGER
jgi:predicted DNA-binding transcriptional regulator YafY